jgi:diaminopimelate decarboxylase
MSMPTLAHRGPRALVAIEDVTLARMLAAVPTPFYATSLGAVEDRARAYVASLRARFPRGDVHYAVKANFAPAILRAVSAAGAGVDIVSVGEWRAALRAGVAPADVCFAGVGKRPAEWREALAGGIGSFNVEHAQELGALLDDLVDGPVDSHHDGVWGEGSYGPAGPRVSLRLNPCVELDTHPHLRTGALDSKFGMLAHQAEDYLRHRRLSFPSQEAYARWVAPVRGIHVHVGSQLQDRGVFHAVAAKVAAFAVTLAGLGVLVNHFDLGGGLGVGSGGVPTDASDIESHVGFVCDELRDALMEVARQHPQLADAWGPGLSRVSVALEPGRSVVASSTLMITTLLYSKSNAPGVRFAYVDAGMNDFPRPSVYGANHHVEYLSSASDTPLGTERAAELGTWQVVGPVCESGDVLARGATLPLSLVPGDVLGFCEAGAYCRSMASHYNLRPLPGEVFVRGGEIVDTLAPVWP